MKTITNKFDHIRCSNCDSREGWEEIQYDRGSNEYLIECQERLEDEFGNFKCGHKELATFDLPSVIEEKWEREERE